MFAFTGEIVLFQWEASRDTLKIQNHPRRLFMPTSIHTYQKYNNLSGDPVPLTVYIFVALAYAPTVVFINVPNQQNEKLERRKRIFRLNLLFFLVLCYVSLFSSILLHIKRRQKQGLAVLNFATDCK